MISARQQGTSWKEMEIGLASIHYWIQMGILSLVSQGEEKQF